MATGGQSLEHGDSFVGGRQLTPTGEYCTRSGLRVSVISADITKVNVDGIVSSNTGRLEQSGGVSGAIAGAAGPDLVRETKQYVKNHGPLAVAQVAVTTGGNLPCRKVLHTVGPRWADFSDAAGCQRSLTDTVFNCLEEASAQQLTSLALPAISSGTFAVPEKVCAASYVSAVERFDRPLERTTLRSIMFVDTRESMIGAMISAFAKRLHANDDKTVRVALVGKVGVGKSSLGNCILGKKAFTEKRALSAVTQESRLEILLTPDCELQIVDTPGLFDPVSATAHKAEIENIKKEIIKSLVLLAPGPHVILVVLSGYDRFTTAELAVYNEIENLFPGSKDHIILVFTHTESQEVLDELLSSGREIFNTLLQSCGRRAAAIEKNSEQMQNQVRQLIKEIQNLKAANRGNHYSNDIMRLCYDLMISTGRPLEEIKHEVLLGRSEELKRLYNNPETKSFFQRLMAKCTIL